MLSSDRVAFMHIPKTAGTTLRLMLGRRIPSEAILDVDAPADGSRDKIAAEVGAGYLESKPLNGVRLVHGHIPLWMCELVADRTITMLRHPADLFASYYSYLRNDLSKMAEFKDLPLVRAAVEDPFDVFMESQTRDGVCRWLCATGHGSETYRLDLARERLASIEFGIAEEFERSSAFLFEQIGLLPTETERANVTTDRYHLTGNERALVSDFNSCDLQLYEWAASEFEKRWKIRQSRTASSEDV